MLITGVAGITLLLIFIAARTLKKRTGLLFC
jgi:hypothetical protein